jgi:plasmid stabilization system protein ParE
VTRQLHIIQPAAEEFEWAVRWYEARRQGLGAEFYDAVSSTMALIAEQPEMGTVMGGEGSTRRVLVSRFPYQAVYLLTPTDLVVVAVAHLKRRPGYWQDRP